MSTNTVTVNVTENVTETNHKPLRPHVVVLHDSEHHTDAYVLEVLLKTCEMNTMQAIEAIKSIISDGRAVVYSAHKELCELKAEQITSFGGDKNAAEMGVESVGPMTVTVEPQ